MATVEDLQHDHDALRRALIHLRDAAREGRDAPGLRAKVSILAGLLRRHLERERQVSLVCCGAPPLVSHQPCPHDVAEPHVLLGELQALLTVWPQRLLGPVAIHALRLLDELWQELDDEERDLFPRLRHAGAQSGEEAQLEEIGAA